MYGQGSSITGARKEQATCEQLHRRDIDRTGQDIAAADKYFGKKPIKHNHEVLGIKGFKEADKNFLKSFRIRVQ